MPIHSHPRDLSLRTFFCGVTVTEGEFLAASPRDLLAHVLIANATHYMKLWAGAVVFVKVGAWYLRRRRSAALKEKCGDDEDEGDDDEDESGVVRARNQFFRNTGSSRLDQLLVTGYKCLHLYHDLPAYVAVSAVLKAGIHVGLFYACSRLSSDGIGSLVASTTTTSAASPSLTATTTTATVPSQVRATDVFPSWVHTYVFASFGSTSRYFWMLGSNSGVFLDRHYVTRLDNTLSIATCLSFSVPFYAAPHLHTFAHRLLEHAWGQPTWTLAQDTVGMVAQTVTVSGLILGASAFFGRFAPNSCGGFWTGMIGVVMATVAGALSFRFAVPGKEPTTSAQRQAMLSEILQSSMGKKLWHFTLDELRLPDDLLLRTFESANSNSDRVEAMRIFQAHHIFFDAVENGTLDIDLTASDVGRQVSVSAFAAPEKEAARTCAICLEDFGAAVTNAAEVVAYKADDDDEEEADAKPTKAEALVTKPVALPCGHCFHSSCIEEWMKHHKRCPSCRRLLKKKKNAKSVEMPTTQAESDDADKMKTDDDDENGTGEGKDATDDEVADTEDEEEEDEDEPEHGHRDVVPVIAAAWQQQTHLPLYLEQAPWDEVERYCFARGLIRTEMLVEASQSLPPATGVALWFLQALDLPPPSLLTT